MGLKHFQNTVRFLATLYIAEQRVELLSAAASARHTLRPYITSVRQCSNLACQNAINWTSKKRHVDWRA